jgi:hypothetical protein
VANNPVLTLYGTVSLPTVKGKRPAVNNIFAGDKSRRKQETVAMKFFYSTLTVSQLI